MKNRKNHHNRDSGGREILAVYSAVKKTVTAKIIEVVPSPSMKVEFDKETLGGYQVSVRKPDNHRIIVLDPRNGS